MEKKKLKRNLLDVIVPIAIVLAIALLILNNFMLYERGIKVAEAKEILKEELRPAKLQLVKITLDDCESCFDIETAIGELKNQNVNITKEQTFSVNSIEGKELISKYDIKKLPTIIVTGELNKSEQLISYFEEKGEINRNSFVYTSLFPPYFDVQSNRINGIVSITYIIDSSCEKCLDLSDISSLLKKQGVFIKEEKFIEYNSKEGRDLIEKFKVRQAPAVLISKDINYYDNVKSALIQSGAKETEGYYAVHSTVPPYRDISNDKIVGLVDVTYLTNNECLVCYDVIVNRNVLLRFGIAIDEENTYDLNSIEGKQLIQKYKISKVPIIVLSPDAKYYPSFEQVWKSVGTIENDGWFIMRNPEAIGTYWDLERNKVVESQ